MGFTVRFSDMANTHDVKTGRNVIRMFAKCKEKALERQTGNRLLEMRFRRGLRGLFTFHTTRSDLCVHLP